MFSVMKNRDRICDQTNIGKIKKYIQKHALKNVLPNKQQ